MCLLSVLQLSIWCYLQFCSSFWVSLGSCTAGSTFGLRSLVSQTELSIPTGGTLANSVPTIVNGILLFTIGYTITFTWIFIAFSLIWRSWELFPSCWPSSSQQLSTNLSFTMQSVSFTQFYLFFSQVQVFIIIFRTYLCPIKKPSQNLSESNLLAVDVHWNLDDVHILPGGMFRSKQNQRRVHSGTLGIIGFVHTKDLLFRTVILYYCRSNVNTPHLLDW
jgi:hypothetical protein